MKHSNNQELQNFAQKVFRLINPKFESESEGRIAFDILMEFSAECELTAEEFIQAIKLSSQGKLSFEDLNGNSTPVKIFREIDFVKLNEIEQAYIQYRNRNQLYEQGDMKIQAYLNPPKETSEEEKMAERIKFLKGQYMELQTNGSCRASVVFYSLLRKKYKEIRLDFIDNFLNNFKPEKVKPNGGLDFSNPIKIEKNDVFLEFKEVFVNAVIVKHKLKEKTEKEWIDFWTELYELKKTVTDERERNNQTK